MPTTLRLLSPADFAALREMHHNIVDLAPSGTVARETDRFLADRLGPRGATLALFVDGRMVAYGILGLPHDRAEALIDRGEADPPRADEVAVLDGVGVLPLWRGNGLHGRFCGWRQDLARDAGRRAFRATAAPDNVWSWRNLLRAGLTVIALRRMYGGAWRYVLAGGPERAPAPGSEALPVAAADLERQLELFARGWTGLAPATLGGQPAILFAPPRSLRA